MTTPPKQTSSTEFDPIIAEVRLARDEMARESGYDLHALCERLRAAERLHPERMAPSIPSGKAEPVE